MRARVPNGQSERGGVGQPHGLDEAAVPRQSCDGRMDDPGNSDGCRQQGERSDGRLVRPLWGGLLGDSLLSGLQMR